MVAPSILGDFFFFHLPNNGFMVKEVHRICKVIGFVRVLKSLEDICIMFIEIVRPIMVNC